MPLKRHPALQDLSRDHHAFLIEARNVRWLLEGDERAESLPITIERLLVFWHEHGEAHLREEETVLFPFCEEHVPELCKTLELERHLTNDHAWLRSKVAELADVPQLENSTPLLRTLSKFIEAHVRHEEREIFEQIQAALTAEQLEDLHARSIAFRTEHRPEGSIGPAQPNTGER